MKKYLHILHPLLVLLVFGGALWLLYHQLKHYHYKDLVANIEAIPASGIHRALGLTALNYLILTGYEFLALYYLGYRVSFRRTMLAAFTGFTMSNNLGWLLGGPAVRYRLYSAWGFSAVEIVKLITLIGATFWMGFVTLAGVGFVLRPPEIPISLHLPIGEVRGLGILCLVIVAAYLAASAFWRRPLRLFQWEFTLPPTPVALGQIAVACLDQITVAGALYVLLHPAVEISFLSFLGVYLLAIVAVAFTHVPGGLGVFELVMLTLLSPDDPARVIGSLLAYRVIYHVLPMVFALLLLGAHELWLQQELARRVVAGVGRWMPGLVPRAMAVCTFLAGATLLLSGAVPPTKGRLASVAAVLSPAVIDGSRLLGSIVGALLLLLARGLQRRVDSAYMLTLALLAAGTLFALGKGFNYEVAAILGGLFLVLLPCHPHFYRKASLWSERFTPGWAVAVGLVLASSLWLALFLQRHAHYSNDVWWYITFAGNAPWPIRATVGATTIALLIAAAHLLSTSVEPPGRPTPDDLAAVGPIVHAAPRTYAHLALLGDKRLLFNDDRTAFLMYGIEGRSWVALGDPVGPEDAVAELAWQFRELCDQAGSWTVFYQVGQERLPLYIDLGMALVKLGEEAHVPLANFTLEGRAHKGLRHACHRVEQAGGSFAVLPPDEVGPRLPEIKHVSDAWLAGKKLREKRFSLGFFQPDYLKQCPMAVVSQAGRVVAFANMLPGAGRQELSIDLMRYLPDAPDGTMDYLFAQLMLWGREHSYQSFNLGMAPLSGMEEHHLAPLWHRVAMVAFRHGEHFYNFQGLRQYKEKFDPVWRPKYLASPGGLALPLVLTNVMALISGGPADAGVRS